MACRDALDTSGLGCALMAYFKGLETCSGNWARGQAVSGLGFRERHYSPIVGI